MGLIFLACMVVDVCCAVGTEYVVDGRSDEGRDGGGYDEMCN